MISCGVCCETVAKAVRCSCEFDACVACAKRYLLESHEDPHCMSCRRAWGREDLKNNFGPTFVSTTYKKHRENILFERERAMLPATQSRLENYRMEKNLAVSILEKKKKASELRRKIMILDAEVRDEIALRARLVRSRWEVGEIGTVAAAASVAVDRILCGCPEDGCVGFLRSSDHACGACGKKACPRCNLPMTDEHECREDDIATAKIIRKETKPCPKCHAPIYRASGCPQMFCTQCQCVFDWGTGLEQTHGVVHNPHYFDWLAKNGRPRDDHRGRQACGFTRLYDLLTAARHVVGPEDRATLWFHVRKAGHLRAQDVPRLPAPGDRADHLELRLQFLDKKITETAFKTAVQREEKKRTRQIELRQIMETYVAAVLDLVVELGTWTTDFAPPIVDHAKVPETVRALESLETYISAQVKALSDTYGVKTPDIMAR